MPYWELVTRSFRIAWNHKYLWLLAFFSGEGGGGFNYSQRQTSSTSGARPDFPALRDQATSWLNGHVGLVVALVVVWLVLIVAFFLLAAICEGATVRASAEHDAERPFGLGLAWRMGLHTMWVIVRYRLILFGLTLPLILLIGGWLIALFATLVNENNGAIAPLVLTGLLLLVAWFVYGTYLFFLDRLGTRAIVLEERMAVPSLGRANGLLFKRLGRTLLVWLLSIGVAIVVFFVIVCASAIVFGPILAAGSLLASSGSGAAAPLIILGVVIVVPLYLLVAGFLSAQGSTYWTLAFRRLDVDYAPAYAYPSAPTAPPRQEP
jgi:hypothetical protein